MSDESKGKPLINTPDKQPSGAFPKEVLDLFRKSLKRDDERIIKTLQTLNLKVASVGLTTNTINKNIVESIEYQDLVASNISAVQDVLESNKAILSSTKDMLEASSEQLAKDNVESLIYLDNILKELQKINGVVEDPVYKKYEVKEHLSQSVDAIQNLASSASEAFDFINAEIPSLWNLNLSKDPSFNKIIASLDNLNSELLISSYRKDDDTGSLVNMLKSVTKDLTRQLKSSGEFPSKELQDIFNSVTVPLRDLIDILKNPTKSRKLKDLPPIVEEELEMTVTSTDSLFDYIKEEVLRANFPEDYVANLKQPDDLIFPTEEDSSSVSNSLLDEVTLIRKKLYEDPSIPKMNDFFDTGDFYTPDKTLFDSSYLGNFMKDLDVDIATAPRIGGLTDDIPLQTSIDVLYNGRVTPSRDTVSGMGLIGAGFTMLYDLFNNGIKSSEGKKSPDSKGSVLSGLVGAGVLKSLLGKQGLLGKTGAVTGLLKKVSAKTLVAGVIWTVYDGVMGFFKSGEWGTSSISAAVGGALAGTGEFGSSEGSSSQAVKWALTGAGLGSKIAPGVGTIAGALIGAAFGSVVGYFGGEYFAKSFDNLQEGLSTVWGQMTSGEGDTSLFAILGDAGYSIIKTVFESVTAGGVAFVETLDFGDILKSEESIDYKIGALFGNLIGSINRATRTVLDKLFGPLIDVIDDISTGNFTLDTIKTFFETTMNSFKEFNKGFMGQTLASSLDIVDKDEKARFLQAFDSEDSNIASNMESFLEYRRQSDRNKNLPELTWDEYSEKVGSLDENLSFREKTKAVIDMFIPNSKKTPDPVIREQTMLSSQLQDLNNTAFWNLADQAYAIFQGRYANVNRESFNTAIQYANPDDYDTSRKLADYAKKVMDSKSSGTLPGRDDSQSAKDVNVIQTINNFQGANYSEAVRNAHIPQ